MMNFFGAPSLPRVTSLPPYASKRVPLNVLMLDVTYMLAVSSCLTLCFSRILNISFAVSVLKDAIPAVPKTIEGVDGAILCRLLLVTFSKEGKRRPTDLDRRKC